MRSLLLSFLFTAVLLGPAIGSVPGSEDSNVRPNLLVIHTDEHNFRTLGCYRATLPREQALMWGKAVGWALPTEIALAPDRRT